MDAHTSFRNAATEGRFLAIQRLPPKRLECQQALTRRLLRFNVEQHRKMQVVQVKSYISPGVCLRPFIQGSNKYGSSLDSFISPRLKRRNLIIGGSRGGASPLPRWWFNATTAQSRTAKAKRRVCELTDIYSDSKDSLCAILNSTLAGMKETMDEHLLKSLLLSERLPSIGTLRAVCYRKKLKKHL